MASNVSQKSLDLAFQVQITFFSSAGEDILAEYLHGVSHCSRWFSFRWKITATWKDSWGFENSEDNKICGMWIHGFEFISYIIIYNYICNLYYYCWIYTLMIQGVAKKTPFTKKNSESTVNGVCAFCRIIQVVRIIQLL